DRKEHFRVLHRHQVLPGLPVGLVLPGENPRELLAQGAPNGPALAGERIQRRAGLDAERGEIEDLLADGDAAARRLASIPPASENAEGQVLDRKLGLRRVGRLDPAFERRVVRLVELHRYSFSKPSQTRS